MTASSLRVRDLAAPGRFTPAGVAGVGSLMILIGAVVTGVVVGRQQPDLLERVGPVALVVAVLLAMPHGALDTELVARGRGRRAVAGACYGSTACLVFAGWTRWPAAAVAVLLVVSAAHFGWIDHVISRWRAPHTPLLGRVCRAAATGALPVSGPFAWWPDRTGPVLGQLGVDPVRWYLFTGAGRVGFAVAAAVGLVTAVSAFRVRDIAGGLEPLAVGAVTMTLPPLLGFAVYFAGWHAWRQTTRLVAVHPDARTWLQRGSSVRAARVVARHAVLPTALALAVVSVLVRSVGDVPAGVLIALLAVSVPHAAVGVVTEQQCTPRRSGPTT